MTERQVTAEGRLQVGRGREGGGQAYRACFVRAGEVMGAGGRPAGIRLAAGALSGACGRGLFDGRAVFIDHAGGQGQPSLHNLVGVTALSHWDGAAVSGEIRLYDTPPAHAMAALLDELLEQGEGAPDVGLSIVFWPVWNPDDPREVCDIRQVESVDLVFAPAAGGRILQALSSWQMEGWQVVSKAGVSKGAESMADQAQSEIDNQKSEIEGWAEAAAAAGARALLGAAELPAASRERLEGQRFTSPAECQAAIAAEKAYLARLAQERVVQLGGPAPRGGQVSGMQSGLDQLSLALDALVEGVRPKNAAPLSGLRELYLHLSGDYELNGVFNPERVQLASVNSSTLSGLVANALNKRVATVFQEYPRWWEPFTSQEDFTSLHSVRWITLGGVGELPTVAEGAAYTELTLDDQTETAAFVKKGGYLGITLESIDKDDTRRLQAAPRALAQGAWLTLARAVSAIFTAQSGTGPNVSDNTALFTSGHGNLGTSALSLTTWAAARTAMRKQTEVNSGERLGALTAPKFLLVPPDLEVTALQLLASPQDYLYTLANGQAAPQNVLAEGDLASERLRYARQRVIVIDLWTDANDWAAVADPRLYPTIGLGFRYGRTPEVFSVASPTAGLMFSNDTLPVKVRFFFAVGPMDWRGLYKANVS